jgi:hypothetical protein
MSRANRRGQNLDAQLSTALAKGRARRREAAPARRRARERLIILLRCANRARGAIDAKENAAKDLIWRPVRRCGAVLASPPLPPLSRRSLRARKCARLRVSCLRPRRRCVVRSRAALCCAAHIVSAGAIQSGCRHAPRCPLTATPPSLHPIQRIVVLAGCPRR